MRFDAIVIGGSHGSFELLLHSLAVLARAQLPPILLAIHIPRGSTPDFVSHFNARCGCRMLEAEDKQLPVNNTMYLAPGGYHVLVERDGHLSLSSDEPVNHAQPSIDVLFQSAAVAYGHRLLAVLLTGASSDGAAGMEQIHALGGTTLVQDPDTAKSPVMPRAAIQRFQPDYLVTPETMADTITTLMTQEQGMNHSEGPLRG